MTRAAQFAGSFYPAAPATLAETLQRLCPAHSQPRLALGVMVPHAGYVYSGRFAGAVFASVTVPDLVLLLGPNHTGLGAPAAVYAEGFWQTPLGSVPVAEDLARALLTETPHLTPDTLAHRREHSLEVLLPLLQHRNPAAQIVPICIGRQSLEGLLRLGAAIGRVLARWPQPVLMVASSDMTHFEPAAHAQAQDRLALERIAAVDATGLYRAVTDHRISMCGVLPMTVLLAAARILGAHQGDIVAYGHSGEVTGDDSDVVAYAGAVIPPPAG